MREARPGAFGPVLPTLQQELGTSRAAVSSAYGVMLLAIGLLAPLVGNITRRVKLRTLMLAGTILNAVGFLILAYARSLTEVLLVFGCIIGPAGCAMGVISAPTPVSRPVRESA